MCSLQRNHNECCYGQLHQGTTCLYFALLLRVLRLITSTVKPVYIDAVYKDKPTYNDIFFGPVGIPIYSMYSEPTYSDNHFLDAPVYHDNFTSLESWYGTISIYFFPWKTTPYSQE
ncbi:hypothetical protein AVEN_119037-1 [Araneus ventricosus]|uniref:Uncharacterized protein n=1 Tax=Araneus ventricosus TaxID=182803 RepID=A0A4Y2FIG3_ARAVE|nr:hypothetical protein AVEN_119037-1 [Araneus ventricosus]